MEIKRHGLAFVVTAFDAVFVGKPCVVAGSFEVFHERRNSVAIVKAVLLNKSHDPVLMRIESAEDVPREAAQVAAVT